jgi:hypothetical protein
MLSLLSRLMISRSLDQGRPPPAWVVRRLERDAELRRFAGSAARLERALSASPPPFDEPPPFLAARIRASIDAGSPAERESLWSPRAAGVAVAGALALAAVFVGIGVLNRSAPAPRERLAQGGPAALIGRLPDATPGSLAASLRRPIMDEAEQFWAGTRRVVLEVADRLPSPPTLPAR